MHQLSGRVHSQDRDAGIYCGHIQEGGGDTAQRGSSSGIRAVRKLPVGDTVALAESLDDTGVGCVGGVGLAGCQFDSHSISHSDLVFDIAFFRMVGMDGMGHI